MEKSASSRSSVDFRVRYVETDQMGVVHHASYLGWLEEGRMDHMRKRGLSYAKIEEMGFFLPVVECKVRYLASARFEQEVILYSWIKEIQPLLALFAYRLEDKTSGQLLLTGHTKHVCVTRAGDVQEIPRAWVEFIAPELLAEFDL
jgi:acyl-CoA thioester hydrolase